RVRAKGRRASTQTTEYRELGAGEGQARGAVNTLICQISGGSNPPQLTSRTIRRQPLRGSSVVRLSTIEYSIPGSSIGRTPASGVGSLGSNPGGGSEPKRKGEGQDEVHSGAGHVG